jgi:shikimate dehydrogenase
LNVTIPYKETILPFWIRYQKATLIGAVNTIKNNKRKVKGYNTDYYGLKNHCSYFRIIALIGTGGASKGVAFALDELGITYTFVSRDSRKTPLITSESTPLLLIITTS